MDDWLEGDERAMMHAETSAALSHLHGLGEYEGATQFQGQDKETFLETASQGFQVGFITGQLEGKLDGLQIYNLSLFLIEISVQNQEYGLAKIAERLKSRSVGVDVEQPIAQIDELKQGEYSILKELNAGLKRRFTLLYKESPKKVVEIESELDASLATIKAALKCLIQDQLKTGKYEN